MGDVFLPVGQAVVVGILAAIRQAVTIRVGTGRVGQRIRPFPGVGQAVVIGVRRGGNGGRSEQADDEQNGGKCEPGATTPRAIHVAIVLAEQSGGNASVVPAG
jgi:hypothetical protein